MAQIVDSYSETNINGYDIIYSNQPGSGQSFTGDGGTLNSAKFSLDKDGSPTGNCYVKIYEHSGTFGTSSVPTGSPLATSDAYNVESLPSSPNQLITFNFSGVNKITLVDTTKYVVTFEYSGGDLSNCIAAGSDTSSPSHAGNRCGNNGSWFASSGEDMCFYVYKDDVSTTSTTTTTTTSTSTTSTTTSTTVSLTTSTSITTTSTSTSTTTTTTSTTTTTTSTTTTLPIFPLPFSGIKIAKSGINVLKTNDPRNLTFSSRYPNLKYFEKGHIRLSFDAGAGDISAAGTYQHNLGYYPFSEVFSSVGSGVYEYCPFFGSGATVAYSTNYLIGKTDITFYCQISGASSDIWTFDFIFFIFKNNLGF